MVCHRWPFVILGVIALWIALAFAWNHGPSGAILGSAVGSTTFRDPLFLLAELTVGLSVRRWWHVVLAAIVISVLYTLVFNGVPIFVASGIRWAPFLGRILSVIVVCSFIVIVADLFRRASPFKVKREE